MRWSKECAAKALEIFDRLMQGKPGNEAFVRQFLAGVRGRLPYEATYIRHRGKGNGKPTPELSGGHSVRGKKSPKEPAIAGKKSVAE